mmetsp:Transcript_37651/g.59536  ORF Transcript_37651/g.59536 Transcript_37651/m.59536 type:complete len:232 (+) Transcript_37651:158-853(+)
MSRPDHERSLHPAGLPICSILQRRALAGLGPSLSKKVNNLVDCIRFCSPMLRNFKPLERVLGMLSARSATDPTTDAEPLPIVSGPCTTSSKCDDGSILMIACLVRPSCPLWYVYATVFSATKDTLLDHICACSGSKSKGERPNIKSLSCNSPTLQAASASCDSASDPPCLYAITKLVGDSMVAAMRATGPVAKCFLPITSGGLPSECTCASIAVPYLARTWSCCWLSFATL